MYLFSFEVSLYGQDFCTTGTYFENVSTIQYSTHKNSLAMLSSLYISNLLRVHISRLQCHRAGD